jgi:hypothetical protein
MYFMRKLQGLIVVAILLMAASIANAAGILPGTDLTNLQNTLNTVGLTHVNAAANVTPDSYWTADAAGSQNRTVRISTTLNSGVFGIYDRFDIDNKLVVFSNISDSFNFNVGENFAFYGPNGTTVGTHYGSTEFTSTQFGYYLTINGVTYYSAEGDNSDGYDHMLTYAGNGVDYINSNDSYYGLFDTEDHLLAWEAGLAPADYNDFLVLVESSDPVSTVPEPSSVLLLGGGLIGLGIASYRKIRK